MSGAFQAFIDFLRKDGLLAKAPRGAG